MKFVSPLLKKVVYPCLARTGYLRKLAKGGDLCVITYHGILPEGYEPGDPEQDGGLVRAEMFRQQLRLLKSRYQVVAPEEVRAWAAEGRKLPKRAVLLTCDDGLLNTLTDMAPILREENLSCIFFVLAASSRQTPSMLWYEELYLAMLAAPRGTFVLEGLAVTVELGERKQRRQIWWELLKKLSQFDEQERCGLIRAARSQFGSSPSGVEAWQNDEARCRRFSVLNADQLRQLQDHGMTIGAHTLSHPILSQQAPELAWREISESRTTLQTALGTEVWALAYPYGDHDSVTSREWAMAERAGFDCAFMNVGGRLQAKGLKFALPRVHVTKDMRLSEFEAHISGFHQAVRMRFAGKSAA